jgi:branched-chain amino acid transport system substrate-binding protein
VRAFCIFVVLSLGVFAACAQQSEPRPYASIDPAKITYSGPDRDAPHDLAGKEIKIGLIAPLQGERKTEGDALVAAAQMAIRDEAIAPLPDGKTLSLVVRDETGLWGRASSEIVKLAVDDRAVALVTSSDGRAAHLAEQVGNRLGVPVVTLATDATTTQINIPWIFRIVPHDDAQAHVFAKNIYRERGFKNVLLIADGDHDGREGAAAFVKAAERTGAASPEMVTLPPQPTDIAALGIASRARDSQAIVIWASAATSTRVLEQLGDASAPIFACRKALEEPFTSAVRRRQSIWVAASAAPISAEQRTTFAERFQKLTGNPSTPAAAELYDAVRLIARGLRQSGANRARLRDALAAQTEYHGISGLITFDGAGNNRAEVAIAPLP